MTSSPIRDAFGTVWRTPSLWLGEVAWRWAFGMAAWVLLLLTLGTWLDSLPLSRVDQVLLGSGSPELMGRALRHIFSGSMAVLLRGCAVLVPGLVLLWTVAASVGRAAILRTLTPESNAHWRSLLGVSFLRAMMTVAAKVCGLAALIVFVRVASPVPPAEGRPGAAWLLFLVLAFVVSTCWWLSNTFLAVAPIHTGAGRSTADALTATFENARAHTGKWFGIATAFGAMHIGLFVMFGSVWPTILSMADAMPRAVTLSAMVITALIYCALVDGISLLRFAAYAAVDRAIRVRVPEKARAIVA